MKKSKFIKGDHVVVANEYMESKELHVYIKAKGEIATSDSYLDSRGEGVVNVVHSTRPVKVKYLELSHREAAKDEK